MSGSYSFGDDAAEFKPITKPTRLESVDELEKLLEGIGATPSGSSRAPTPETARDSLPESSAVPTPTPHAAGLPAEKRVRFRPLHRPPTAALCILDDGQDNGEWVRIRSEEFVIGRAEGNLLISNDPLVSVRHAQILRIAENDSYRWKLVDLDSTNGTYVRVNKAAILHDQELLVGNRRFRFSAPPQGAGGAEVSNDPNQPARTKGWESVNIAELLPSLVEVTPAGDGNRIMLNPKDNWVGADRGQCNIILEDDATLAPRHTRIHRDSRGWQVENGDPLNGTWLRVTRAPLKNGGYFQLGEQRFQFKTF